MIMNIEDPIACVDLFFVMQVMGQRSSISFDEKIKRTGIMKKSLILFLVFEIHVLNGVLGEKNTKFQPLR